VLKVFEQLISFSIHTLKIMDRTIELVDEKKGIIQITDLSERWYAKPYNNEETGLPEGYKFFPSVTWIAGCYPKNMGFVKWIASKGFDEAEAIKVSAGDKGSKVHLATEVIEQGKEVKINDSFPSKVSGMLEELTIEEVDCIQSFIDWLDETRPEVLMMEKAVFGDGYAGTIDRIYRIDGQIWIIDLKTSKAIWPEHEIQISAYSHADIDYKALGITTEEWAERKLAILQLGYDKYRTEGKARFKFTEVKDKFDLFLASYKIWQNENPTAKPKTTAYPLVLKSKFKAEQTEKKVAEKIEKPIKKSK
jgi:hypothetical protein